MNKYKKEYITYRISGAFFLRVLNNKVEGWKTFHHSNIHRLHLQAK